MTAFGGEGPEERPEGPLRRFVTGDQYGRSPHDPILAVQMTSKYLTVRGMLAESLSIWLAFLQRRVANRKPEP